MRQRINDAFATWYSGGGIFAALQDLSVPWASLGIADELDLEYHGNVSGEKIVSPLVRKLQTGDALSSEEIAELASIIASINAVSWSKEYATLSAQYQPVENYDMTETMTNDQTATVYGHSTTRTDNLTHAKTGTETQRPDLTDTRTDNLTHSKTGTETQTPDTTETVTHDTSDETTYDTTDTRTDDLTDETTHGKTDTRTDNLTTVNKVSAYNGTSMSNSGQTDNTGTQTMVASGTDTVDHDGTVTNVKSGTDTIDHTGTDTTTRTGTDTMTYNTSDTDTGTQTTTHAGSDTMTYNTSDTDTGTQTQAESGTDTQTRNYTLRRHGNIGVTTSQQMLESERSVWLWNFFRQVVYPDVDRVLSIPIY